MSQTYEQRRDSVVQALVAEEITTGAGKTLSDVAARVLAALDGIKEDVR